MWCDKIMIIKILTINWLFYFDEILIGKFATARKCQLVVDCDVLIMTSDCSELNSI